MKDVLRQAATIFVLALAALAVPLLGFLEHNMQVIVTEEVVRVVGWLFAGAVAIAVVSVVLGLGRSALTLRIGLALSAVVALLLMHSSLGLSDTRYWALVAGAALFSLALGVKPVVHAATAGAVVAALFPLWEIVSAERIDISADQSGATQVRAPARPGMPNVYFFVTDGYAGPKALSTLHGIDNSSFLNGLRSRGYFVPDGAKANYPMTFMAISAMYEMDYIADEKSEPFKNRGIFHGVFSMHNASLRAFESLGYTTVKQSSGYWGATRCHEEVDVCFEPAGRWYLTQLEYNILLLTPLHMDRYETLHPPINTIGDAAKRIDELLDEHRPFYYFGHTLPPHTPMAFDDDCNQLSNWQEETKYHGDGYALQIRCVNGQVTRFVDEIAAKDPDAIVILTADHGNDKFVDWNARMDAWDQKAILDRYNIFLAVKMPQRCSGSLTEDLTPVNLLRVALGCIKGEPPELVENKSFIAVYEQNPDYGKVHRIHPEF